MMNWRQLGAICGFAGIFLASGCGRPAANVQPDEGAGSPRAAAQTVITFQPGPDAQKRVMEELILAEPGAEFQFEEGVYDFTEGLSLTVNDVTIRGRGMDKTILSFRGQEAGAEGLYITGDNVTVEDLAIEDTKGNGLKSLDSDNIVLRRVRAEWTGGPKSTNGAYGLYPVSSQNVLIEECVAIGGSDSGIYVGQSKNVIVRNCRVSYNVAGIEIENCHQADVYGNEAFHNTGGILVFDLPDLPQQHGHDVRVFKNNVHHNNTDNFAPEGNIVATVPAGTGVMVMATNNVEIFENDIRDHQTVNILVVSYLITNIEIKDPSYYPYPEKIHIHHNLFGPGGNQPGGAGGQMIAAVTGLPMPDIVWDGVVHQEQVEDGPDIRQQPVLSIRDNEKDGGPVTFANLGGLETLMNPQEARPLRDLSVHAEPFSSIAPVSIPGVQ